MFVGVHTWIVEHLSNSATGECASASEQGFHTNLRRAWNHMVRFNAMNDVPPYYPFDDPVDVDRGFASYCLIPGVIVKQDYRPLDVHIDRRDPPTPFGLSAPGYYEEEG